MENTKTSDRITLAELERLLENLAHSNSPTDKKVRMALIIQYYTSLRFGDCKRISFGEIINSNKFELKEEKTGKSKTITANKKLKREVEKYFKEMEVSLNDKIIDVSIQYMNRKLKQYKYKFGVKNYSNDSKFNFSTHSTRKCSLFQIYKKAGINVSLKISNHSSIDVHLKYICAQQDVMDAYLCL